MKMLKATFVTSTFLISSITQAATAVYDNFDAGLNGWGANTTQTNVNHSLAGGNPNGYLATDNLNNETYFGAIGSVNTGADYSGVFADGLWTVSVDLNFIRGDFTDARLRYRYQDAGFNGWYYSLTNSFDNSWTNYSVTFDTTWSDAEAILNGWTQEDTSSSFAALWDNAYTSEIRLVGTPNTNLVAGIDNYRASVVPLPAAVWLFLSGLTGLIAISRKKA
ncbi:MAG: VPLPA-CTERM sorting domain-containing protein [Gammaproteobacteria bacterium]|nr:VPLPA-CTERM sorting domain-containing protein [Gammaproteobacteria bacterium]